MYISIQNLKRENRILEKDILKAIKRVISSANYTNGKEIQKFETYLAKFCNTKYAIATKSGTDSLFLSLKALGVQTGDEVITSPLTFIATAEAIVLTGATPVFVDIDPETWNINPQLIEKSITSKTKAIICVHLYGVCCDMDAINTIAKKFGLFVIEDAAHAHGSLYKGKPTGSLADVGCFSFYPTKTLGALGNAGGATTNNKIIADKIRALADHGRTTKRYEHKHIGLTATIDAIQAAILTEKLKHLASWIKKRTKIVSMYQKHILVPVQKIPPNVVPSFYTFAIRVKNRDRFQKKLHNKGIETQVFYPIPVHLQQSLAFLKNTQITFPVTESLVKEIVSLPLYPSLTIKEQNHIIKALQNYGFAS